MTGSQIVGVIMVVCGVAGAWFGYTGPEPDPKQISPKRAMRIAGPVLVLLGLGYIFVNPNG